MGDSTTVLVVDDDAFVRAAFVRMLALEGFAVREAADGSSGLQAFRDQPPACVVLDLRMPDMDGLDVLQTMVSEAPQIPVVVVSGAGTMQDAVEALRRGAWDFVVKPIADSWLLVHPIERALEKARLLDENRAYRRGLEHVNHLLAQALAELRAEQEAARQVQFQLLPPEQLVLGKYVASRRLFPSQVLSGDFVDYFPIGTQFAGFYVADVSGHGAASAFVTAILTTLVGRYREAFALDGDQTILDPARLLDQLHHDVRRLVPAKHVSMLFATLELASGEVRYANAGLFPFPVVCEPGCEPVVLACPGRPLGLPGPRELGTGSLRLARGARLVVVSDGVLELGPEGSQRAQRARLARVFAETTNVEQLAGRLGLPGTALRDDVAILYLRGADDGDDS
jgi:sigma-B regulation protein RsbU (phosphoserine phosphatase)